MKMRAPVAYTHLTKLVSPKSEPVVVPIANQEKLMAKRSARRASRRTSEGAHICDSNNVRRLFDEPQWSSLDDNNRDQKYRKNIRAQNDSQKDHAAGD